MTTDSKVDSSALKEFLTVLFERKWFLKALEDDVSAAEALLQSSDTEFNRRTLVRTILTQVEGLTAVAVDEARARVTESRDSGYTEAQRRALDLHTANVDRDGNATLAPVKYLETKTAIRFALNLRRAVLTNPPKIDFGDGGWDALQKGIAARHRLMHPKQIADIEVTDDDLRFVRQGREWIVATHDLLEKAAVNEWYASPPGKEFVEQARRTLEATQAIVDGVAALGTAIQNAMSPPTPPPDAENQ